ncbi:MAG: DNA mismatch repair endonuclease MutL [candidate division Zixibacteria bacterium]|nr:DNA mismatch repair endonuclease MutL [candidate division Zixibacteria bacterium]
MTAPAPRWIRPLSERLINKIAAGEVIERPSAVVKELVENALDAGATSIDVFIEQSGVGLIKIVDNGCGIAAEQIEIAFSRHATSKISNFSDLDSIQSYGFRGEALPSIASVSRMRMTSRPASQETAMEIRFEGGVLQSKLISSCVPGTIVEVADLFFNTPARRKFLKAESTESRHISRTMTALAIGRFDVGFSFTVNSRNIFSLPPRGTLGNRVSELLGGQKQFIEVTGERGPVKLHGFIGLPESSQRDRWGQYIFINGRLVQSITLGHAFAAGYGELLPRGQYPIGALLLTIDPSEVDVNVHPAKTEVRLSREREIHDTIHQLIKSVIRKDDIIPTFHSFAEPELQGRQLNALIFRPSLESSQYSQKQFSPSASATQEHTTGIRDDKSEFRVDPVTGEILDEPMPALPTFRDENLPQPANQITLPGSDTANEELSLVGRFADLYLLFQRGKNLLIVDQHTAHERVLFEQTLRDLERESMIAQRLLLPVQINLSPEQFALFDEAQLILKSSGFEASHFGGRTIMIDAVPAILSRKSPERITLKILDDIGSLRKTGYDLKKAVAQSVACRAAVMKGDKLSDREAVGLIQSLLRCENMYSCPHGRPTFVKITSRDLDRQFGRG